MAITFPKLTIPTGRTPSSIISPTSIKRKAVMTKVKPQVSFMPSRRPSPSPRIQVPIARFQPPKTGAVQDFINKWTGATPEQPIKLPFQYGQVEAGKRTRNLILGVGAVITVALLWPRG